MKLDTRLWNRKDKLIQQLGNYAKVLLISSIMNGTYMYIKGNWILFGYNMLLVLITAGTLISKFKWEKDISYEGD